MLNSVLKEPHRLEKHLRMGSCYAFRKQWALVIAEGSLILLICREGGRATVNSGERDNSRCNGSLFSLYFAASTER